MIAAKKEGASIVTYDWLEDSLQRKRKLSETKYLLSAVAKERRKRKEIKQISKFADSMSHVSPKYPTYILYGVFFSGLC